MTDVKWGVFNKRGIEYASKRLWGLYRNNRMDMADLLEKEGKLEQALSTYLEVCYLDLNGPENLTEVLTQRELQLYGEKDFDITSGFLAPGVVYQVSKLIAKLELTKNEVKEKFISENTPDRPLLKMPLSAEKAWQKLEANMKEDEANEKKIETFNVEDSDLLVSEIKKTGKKKNDTLTPIIYKFRNQYRKKEKITSEYNEIKAVIEALLYTNNLDISYQSLGTSLMVFFAKKDKELFSGLILDYIKFIKSNNKVSLSDPILGQLGEINSSWVASFVPEMIEMLQKKSYWNEKRFVGFNLGQIGSKSPELVKEAIPIMVKYIKENKTTQEIFGFDEKSWLKDGYIDALSMIALGDKSLLSEYKSLFEDISKNEGSEYSRKKANAVLQLIS